ncbi:YfhH family protein [Terribacillus sp. DMT04]|uniref:YfhH family protein n=1 Tax=Terribacillus sp. DMT04 TaxID=2850441 RepID=UPI001C2BAC54|nr:YfhH family protein [Terribacillus sp. DMT04]QXE02521.1 YfhH family protein [Terribacillus sp. DMT04]
MQLRYSDLTIEQLKDEMKQLKIQQQKAEQMGNFSEYQILERKRQMAKAYTLNPHDFKAGATYEIKGDRSHVFTIDYMNGVFAWGYRRQGSEAGQELEALPISVLGKVTM